MTRNNHPPLRRRPSRPFTLVELIVAMATFSILMLVMIQFFGTAQGAWRTSDANTRIYENARIAFEIIKRDLRSAAACNRTGEEIPFTIGATADRLSLVTAVPTTQDAKSELCEVHYALSGNSLLRNRVCDSSSSWNFFGKKDASWVDAPTAGDELIPGVTDFRVTCRMAGVVSGVTDSSGKVLPSQTLNTLPLAVEVTMTLVDERLNPATTPTAKLNQTKRTFTRTFFLN